jgi:alanyl-tRNA synthetase
LSKEELLEVEKLVNSMVRENNSSNITNGIPMDKARKMGAIALFGEKYGDTVRVVEFGKSVELCGGTHLESTGSIGIVKITSESAIASGVRRIEAVTASVAENYINMKINTIDEITILLKSTGNIIDSINKLIDENTTLKKTIEKYQAQSADIIIKELLKKAVFVGSVRFISGKIETDSPDVLKNIAYRIRGSADNIVLAIGSETKGKASMLVMVSDNLVHDSKISAVEIVREIASEISGSGGGQPFLAIAGGKNPAGIERAILKTADYLKKF